MTTEFDDGIYILSIDHNALNKFTQYNNQLQVVAPGKFQDSFALRDIFINTGNW